MTQCRTCYREACIYSKSTGEVHKETTLKGIVTKVKSGRFLFYNHSVCEKRKF